MNEPTNSRKQAANSMVPVWDPVVRITHGIFVFGCSANLLLEDGGEVHRAIGYVVAVAVIVRLAWGFVATGHARFRAFVPSRKTLWNYLKMLYRNSEPRYMGHNPAGSVMILTLLSLLVGICITGWMLALERLSDSKALEALHEALAMTLLLLVGIHILAGIVGSMTHKDNLIKSMITGRKRAPDAGDIDDAIDLRRRQ